MSSPGLVVTPTNLSSWRSEILTQHRDEMAIGDAMSGAGSIVHVIVIHTTPKMLPHHQRVSRDQSLGWAEDESVKVLLRRLER